MPLNAHPPSSKLHSSHKTTHCSHSNLTSHSVVGNPCSSPLAQPPQTSTHSALVSQHSHHHSRSRGNLVVKKRPLGLSRNNTSVILHKAAATSSSHPRKPPSSSQRRARGAFQGALDPDPNEDHDDPDEPCLLAAASPKKSHREEEAWVSEPSTRSGTPTTPQPPLELKHRHAGTQLDSLPLLNPIPPTPSLPRPVSPTPQPIDPPPPLGPSTPIPLQTPPDDHPPPLNPSSQSRGRSAKCIRDSVESSQPPRVLSGRESPESLDGHLAAPRAPQADPPTPPQNVQDPRPPPTTSPNSPQDKGKDKGKGKGKTPPALSSKTQRASIHSVHSLSSLSIFHNDLLLNHTHPLSRQGLKRVDSTASVVLPPKVDTTEAVITLSSKGTFYPTLNAISDLPSGLGEAHFSNPPSYSTEPSNSTACTPRVPPSDPQHMHPLKSDTNKTHSTWQQSECTRRLQRFSNLNGPPHHINLKAANDLSSGLMSSLLSPQMTLKSRWVQTPGAQSHAGNGSGYFDSLKSLVGMSGLAGDPTKPIDPVGAQDSGHHQAAGAGAGGTPPPGGAPSPQTYTPSSKSGASTGATSSSSLPQDNKIPPPATNHHSSLQRHPLVHHQQQQQQQQLLLLLPGGPTNKLSIPKPVVPGFITTCGPTPVVSKFLGPRPVQPSNIQNENLQSSTTITTTTALGHSQGCDREELDKTQEGGNPLTSSSLHPHPHSTTLGQQSGSSSPFLTRRAGTDSTVSLSRIQKKLLMERDRPISPTLFEQTNHPTITAGSEFGNAGNSTTNLAVNTLGSSFSMGAGAHLASGGSSTGTLPPPSYLIRSLGGQTGPLPFIPLNLLPSTQTTTPTPPNPNTHQIHTPITSTKLVNTPTNEKNNSAPLSHPRDPQLNTTKPPITPTTPHVQPQPQEVTWMSPASEVAHSGGSRLNEPALKAKQALSIKLWRNSLIDEVEQILTDHESNTRFRNPLLESFHRVSRFNQSFSQS